MMFMPSGSGMSSSRPRTAAKLTSQSDRSSCCTRQSTTTSPGPLPSGPPRSPFSTLSAVPRTSGLRTSGTPHPTSAPPSPSVSISCPSQREPLLNLSVGKRGRFRHYDHLLQVLRPPPQHQARGRWREGKGNYEGRCDRGADPIWMEVRGVLDVALDFRRGHGLYLEKEGFPVIRAFVGVRAICSGRGSRAARFVVSFDAFVKDERLAREFRCRVLSVACPDSRDNWPVGL